jgi:hypothetical protein
MAVETSLCANMNIITIHIEVNLESRDDITGGWWHLHWGERARNDWRGISGMVSNTVHQTQGFQVFDAIPFAPFRTLL